MIRKSGNRFSEKIMLKQRYQSASSSIALPAAEAKRTNRHGRNPDHTCIV